ncbi:MAG: hypothetical protein Q4B98_03565 [Cutibacterium sp.]|nr:hypothetical protein [Cutibacterium sp.]MDO4412135.1 hypothetical protein [Cutibacterium sp.]
MSAATMAKLGKGENVTNEMLARICETLERHCRHLLSCA